MKTSFELTPYGVNSIGCEHKNCPRFYVTPKTNRLICRTSNGCVCRKPIEYYAFERSTPPSSQISIAREIEENYSRNCPECLNGEMWGNEERGFVCTFCGKEIEGKKEQEEELVI